MAPKKKAVKKKSPAKKPIAKKPAAKAPAKPKAPPAPPRTTAQLAAAKVARAAILPEAIKVGRAAFKKWCRLSTLAEVLQEKQASHPLAPDLTTADWRNLALRVIRQFERQPNVLEMRGRKAPQAGSQAAYTKHDGPFEYRILTGAKPDLGPLGRRRKDGGFGAKPKAAKPAKKAVAKKGTPTKKAPVKKAPPAKKAAPKKRGE